MLSPHSSISLAHSTHLPTLRSLPPSELTKMQFAPPTKESDVTIGAVDGNEQGVDQNGLVVGRWKTGIFGFTDSLVPNGASLIFSFTC